MTSSSGRSRSSRTLKTPRNRLRTRVVVLEMRNFEDPAGREHSRGEDAQNPQEDDARREKLTQTTIKLAKVNQTCLFEIPQIQCSEADDSKITPQVSNTQQSVEDCISQDEIKQRTVEQVEGMHDQHDQYDVHAVKMEVQDHQEHRAENEPDHPGEDQSGAMQSNTSGHLPCRYATIRANDAQGTESGERCDSLRCSTSTRSSKVPVNTRNTRIPCVSQQTRSTARRPTR